MNALHRTVSAVSILSLTFVTNARAQTSVDINSDKSSTVSVAAPAEVQARAQLAAPPQNKIIPRSGAKIGLVLSGGGARGLAHVGVLRALEEQRIPIDYIAGTSAGALVGGMYASGMSVNEIEQRIKSMDFDKILFEKTDRRTQTQFTRDIENQGNGMVDLSITRDGAIALPKAVVNGARVEEALRDILKDYPLPINFDQLPIPFRAVASDIGTGEKVVLDHGVLSQALRASMAIPAVFEPVEIDGRLLTDGMVSSNLPIEVVRQMGAKHIIAINVGTGLLSKDKINNVVNVSEQLLNILVERNVTDEVKTLKKGDVYVKIDTGDVGNLEFNRITETSKLGYEAMAQAKVLKSIQAFSATPTQYQAWSESHTATPNSGKIIDFVRVETNGLANPETLEHKLAITTGKPLDMDEVNANIRLLLSIDRIESVKYAVLPTGTRNELVYYVREKDIANNALRAGIDVSSNSLTNQKFALHFAHRNVWINNFGAEWRNYLTLGNNSEFKTQFNQPLSTGQGWYIRPEASIGFENTSAYLPNQNIAASSYNVKRQYIGALLGQATGPLGEWGVGIGWRETRVNENLSNPNLPIAHSREHRFTVDVQSTVDQLDDFFIPTQGVYSKLYANVTPSKLDDARYIQAGWRSIWAKRLGAGSLALSVEAAGHNSKGSIYNSPFHLGGYHHLSGYEQNQFVGNYMMFGSVAYRYISPWRVLNEPLVLGATLEAGQTWNRLNDVSAHGVKNSATLFSAINTPIGPAQFGVGFTRGGASSIYFFLGRTFSGW